MVSCCSINISRDVLYLQMNREQVNGLSVSLGPWNVVLRRSHWDVALGSLPLGRDPWDMALETWPLRRGPWDVTL